MRISKFEDLIPQNIAPKGVKRIGVYNSKNERVGSFGLGNLTPPRMGRLLYSFGEIADAHMQRTTATEDLIRALSFFNNHVDFIINNGDFSESGTEEQMQEYKDCIDNHAEIPVYAVSGNHETYGGLDIPNVIETYTGQPFYYSFEVGNDVFIMLGIKDEYELFTQAELQWLYETLEANRNKRCFVFMHVFPSKETIPSCGNAYGIYHNYCWSHPTQTVVFESLMKHYKNVLFFHGHSHLEFALQSKDCQYANYDESNGYRSIHIPALSILRSGDSTGSDSRYDIASGSQGYVVDVYENGIHLRGRDFVKGEFLPIASYWLDTTLVNVEANTYVDSTGTITI